MIQLFGIQLSNGYSNELDEWGVIKDRWPVLDNP